MQKQRFMCTACAARTMAELLDSPLRLICIDTKQRKAACDDCGKTKRCMTYEIGKQ